MKEEEKDQLFPNRQQSEIEGNLGADDIAERAGLQVEGWDNIEDKPDSFTPAEHDHDEDYLTKAQLRHEGVLDGRYYTKGEIDAVIDISNATFVLSVAVRAYLGTEQTNLTHATWTTVQFDTEDFDVGGNFASYTFTSPIAGYYDLRAHVELNDLAIGWWKYGIRLNKNSGTIITQRDYDFTSDATSRELSLFLSDLVYLSAADTIVVDVKNDFASADTMDISSGQTKTFFIARLVGK